MQAMIKWLCLSVISFCLSSLAILISIYTIFSNEQGNMTVIYGAVFWAGFIAGFVFQIPIQRKRKRDSRYKRVDKRFLFLRFFRNKPAIVFDILLILGAFILVLCTAMFFLKVAVFTVIGNMLTPAAVFAVLLSLEMHCLFNGKNYEYICMQSTWQYNLRLSQGQQKKK